MLRISRQSTTWDGSQFEITYKRAPLTLTTTLSGTFNIYNLAALCGAAQALDFTPKDLQSCVARAQAPTGRLERVPISADFTVVVDYAHTPDALENVLSTARKLTKGKLICVFGCGGDRDRGKRPRMAAAVAAHCDRAIITSDNPRSEEPEAIIAEIIPGLPQDFAYSAIAGRREAIAEALNLARSNDCIVIAGKGHEDYQEIKGVKNHFNDRETVLELTEAKKVS
jgi:UDP-N-acetylmuramoyl-L-alanyl-D-glutamate--2,6-diaminopimelate ligase